MKPPTASMPDSVTLRRLVVGSGSAMASSDVGRSIFGGEDALGAAAALGGHLQCVGVDLALQRLQAERRQRVLEVEALPRFRPGAGGGAGVDRPVGIAHDGHDDDLARLLLDEGDAFLLQHGAHTSARKEKSRLAM